MDFCRTYRLSKELEVGVERKDQFPDSKAQIDLFLKPNIVLTVSIRIRALPGLELNRIIGVYF